MKNFISILLFLTLATTTFSQFHSINFGVESSICPFTGETINTFEDWEVYQTLEDEIDGSKRTICFETTLNGSLKNLEDAIDGSPIFIRNSADLNINLESQSVLSLFFNTVTTGSDFCNCKLDCLLPSCFSTKLFFSTEIDGNLVNYERILSDPIVEGNAVTYQNCFLLNKGENTKLHNIEITIIKEDYSLDETIFLQDLFISQSFGTPFANRVVTNEFFGPFAYFVDARFFGDPFFGHTLAFHKGPGLPGLNNRYFYDIIPENSSSQQIINIVLSSDGSILFQDFTHLRPALVNLPGNDTLRHKLNLINEGATLCFDNFIEIISSGEDKFIHKSGGIDFHSSNACLQFNDKAELVIAKGATFDYGYNGVGLLALNQNAQIVFEPDATLNFNGKIVLKKTDINDVQISLEKNTSLKFGRNSSITSLNDPSEVQITIFMKGGHLDVSELDDESMAYLNIIYDEDDIDLEDRFLLYPNPAEHFLYVNNLSNTTSKFHIYNQNNMLVEQMDVEPFSKYRFDSTDLAQGIYFIKSEFGVIKKFVVSR